MLKNKNLYISTFEIFHYDAKNIIEFKYKNYCKDYGYSVISPFDNDEKKYIDNPEKMAQHIVYNNMKNIDNCDIIIANLNNFRNNEPDTGTIWECGYATGKNKIVIGYKDKLNTYIENYNDFYNNDLNNFYKSFNENLDEKGLKLNNFGYTHNIMISINSIIIEGNFFDAIDFLNKLNKEN